MWPRLNKIEILFQIAEKNGVIHIFNIASYKVTSICHSEKVMDQKTCLNLQPILSLHCGAEPLLTADWSISNSLLISAAVRSDLILFDQSKMATVSKKKTNGDIIKSLKLAPFCDFLLASSSQPNYNVQVTNLRSNQVISIVQKEPISGIAWFKKKQILVSMFFGSGVVIILWYISGDWKQRKSHCISDVE